MFGTDPGREWLRTTLYSIGDAVITTDARGCIREMNPVAEALTGWIEGDAAGRRFDEVFVALNQVTRARVPDPVTAILRDGVTIGLAHHTLLVARDGRERPVADSGAPIRDANGALLGTVIVFRDRTDEQRQMDALEQSERRHRDLFHANPNAMWVYDDETLEFLEVNAAAVARYGYTRDEFMAMTLRDIRPPEDIAALLEDVASVPDGFEGGRRWRHRRRDGSLLTVEISSHPVPWPGRDARLVLVHDVTATASLELRLQWQAQILTRLASNESLQTLLDELTRFVCSLCPGVLSSIMLVDADGRALRPAAGHGVPDDIRHAGDPTPIEANAGVCGSAAAQLQPFVVDDVPNHPAFDPYREVAERHGLLAAWSYPFFDSHGRLLGTSAMYATDSGGPTRHEAEVARFAATLAGVMVERARNFDALREREAQLRAIFENEPEGVMVFDRTGRLQEINPAGLALLQAPSVDTVRGADIGALVTAEFRPAFAALTTTVAAGGDGRLEFELIALGGSRRWVDIHAAPLRDAHGRITAVLGITRDVSERKALAAELLQAQKLESVGRLAGGVAHDFNNMLGVIQGQTELTLLDLPADSPAAEGLREVLQAAQRSARLTRQLLAFARREPSEPRVVDLNHRVDELIGMLERLIGEGVTVTWTPGVDLWRIRVDPTQLDQVLTNLVVNARDAMDGIGSLTVTTANVTRQASDDAPGGDYVQLAVADTGKGMDAATRAHIFEPFFTTKPLGQGTGLGLATVYGVVRQHGGVVEVESEPGRGATFRVLWPRSTGAVAPSGVRAPKRPTTGGGEAILVVEDEPALLHLICQVLTREGYRTHQARSPREAEAILNDPSAPLQLLLTDMVMPGMSGRDLWLRARAVRPTLRCLVMSGYARDVVESGQPLDLPLLHKPFAMHALVESVRLALDEGRAAS